MMPLVKPEKQFILASITETVTFTPRGEMTLIRVARRGTRFGQYSTLPTAEARAKYLQMLRSGWWVW